MDGQGKRLISIADLIVSWAFVCFYRWVTVEAKGPGDAGGLSTDDSQMVRRGGDGRTISGVVGSVFGVEDPEDLPKQGRIVEKKRLNNKESRIRFNGSYPRRCRCRSGDPRVLRLRQPNGLQKYKKMEENVSVF